MKKILQSITIVLMLGLLFTGTGFAQEIQLTKPASAGELPDQTAKDGQWIGYYQSVNDNALGLGGDGAQWNAAIRWMPADLEAFEGYSVTRIRIFINDEPNDGLVKIWQGNPDIENGEWPDEYVSQAMSVVEEDWVEVELFDPYTIDTSMELWIGWEMGDKGDGNFPAAFDNQNPVVGNSDLLQFGDNPWQPGANFGFDIAWNIEAFVVPADDDDDPDPDPDDTYSVTFNVDMTGVEGFDPNEHHVFMTGTPTGWAEPGTEGSLQLQLVPPAAKNPPYTFYENFEGYDDFTTDLSPWITLQLTEGNTWGAGDFDFPGEGTEFAWMAFNPSATEPPIDETDPPVDGSKVGMAIQYTDIDDDKWLISPEFSINETSVLSFHARSHTHAYGAERIRVLVSTTGSDPGNFIAVSDEPYIEVPVEWTEYVFPLGDYDGETLRFAINYVSNDAFIFFIDAITLSAEADDPDPGDVLIYTATLDEVEAGTIEYKYFSDAFGAGWDGGEWPGDPNREAEIAANTILDDVWGVYDDDDDDDDTSVPVVLIEEINVYPNPASSNLTVTSNSIMLDVTVYDITGRAVMSASVNDNTHVFDVSSLRNGLYIMQVKTVDGIEGLRFHVVK